MANVRILDLVFDGGQGYDGFYIRGRGLKGVLDGVDVRRKSIERSERDGVSSGRSLLAPRIVEIGGLCWASSAEELDHYSSRLKSLQAIRDDFVVVFDLPGRTLWGKAHVSDKPTFNPIIWGQRAIWDLELQFDVPQLFGDAVTFPNANYSLQQVHHRGNDDALPVYTVVGAATGGYTITGHAGKVYTVTRPLVAGQPHTIDMSADGLLAVNGQIVMGGVTTADIWTIPAGIFVPHSITAIGGTASLTATVPPTYI